jgi:hypothetical protein
MRKIFISLLLILLLALPVYPATTVSGRSAPGGVPSGDECAGYSTCEDAEGSGTPADWTNTGSPDWDYTTDPAPLRGTQSVALETGDKIAKGSLTGGDVWAFVRWQAADGQPESTSYVLLVYDSTPTILGKVQINTNGAVRHSNGDANATSAGTLADGATGNYCVWWHLKRGSSVNTGESHVWYDLCSNVCSGGTCTRPESETISAITTGTWDGTTISTDALTIQGWCAGTSNVTILDEIRTKTTEINEVEN